MEEILSKTLGALIALYIIAKVAVPLLLGY